MACTRKIRTDCILNLKHLDTASVENYMDRQRRVQEKGKDLIAQIQSVSENMKSNADKLSTTLTSEIQKQFNSIFKRLVIRTNNLFSLFFFYCYFSRSMQDKLTSSIKEVVADQVKQGFKSHAAVIEDSVINAVRSRAVTPSPHIDSHVCGIYYRHQLKLLLLSSFFR